MFIRISGFISGTSDLHKQFYPISLNICTNETEKDFFYVQCNKKGFKFF